MEDFKLNTIQGLWIGPKLSSMEKLSISSFVKHGHEYVLYTYNKVEGIPAGVTVKDANEIIPLSFLHYKDFSHLALFADFFRYKLLYLKGGWWVDTDVICVKPFDFIQEYVFASEFTDVSCTKESVCLNNGIIKVPKASLLMQECWSACLAMDIKNISWGSSGPRLLTSVVKKFDLQKYATDPVMFCPANPWDTKKFKDTEKIYQVPEASYSVHLWDEMWRRGNENKEDFPLGSFYERLYKNFVINPLVDSSNDVGAIPASNKVIKSLWIGKLSPLEQLSIASYLNHGHEFHLYTYNMDLDNVPEGAVVKSADEIIPRSLYNYKKFCTLGAFSDFFRYKLLLDKGGWWSDMDSICLRPFDFEDEYVFSSNVEHDGKFLINSANIKVPIGSPVISFLWKECQKFDIDDIVWGDVGPHLLKKGVEKFGLTKKIKHPNVFCPMPWWDTDRIQDSDYDLVIPSTTRAMHIGNEQFRRLKKNKSFVPADSIYGRLIREFLPDRPSLTNVNLTEEWNTGSEEFNEIMNLVKL